MAACGIEHTRFGSEDLEGRVFADDDQATKDGKQRAEAHRAPERLHLARIEPHEAGFGHEALAEAGAGAEAMRAANGRLNQCSVWFNFLRDERPGAFCLTATEVMTARRALRAAPD